MANLDQLAVTMREIGEGPWTLILADGETVSADIEDIEISDLHGFEAEGHTEEGDLLKLSTGIQPGGAIHLQRRPSAAADWNEVGEVVDADKQDYV